MRFEEILEQYDIGPVTNARTLGGTAGETLRIAAADTSYVLRRRGTRTSGLDRVSFDSSLRRTLSQHGLPVVAPISTRGGADGVATDDGFWELTPFVEGHAHRQGDRRELVSLARALAAFHHAGSQIRAAGRPPPLHRQFTLAAPGVPVSARIDDPSCMRAALEATLPLLAESERVKARRMLGLVQRVVDHYGGARYAEIDSHLVHGDLHPANILFDEEGGVAGLFDLDWAAFAPRVRDLADLVWFFAGAPLSEGTDIWALTAARRVDAEPARVLLREYSAAFPVTRRETDALPWAWLARWIAIHMEGMYKVPPDERGRFLTRDMGEPVERMLSMDCAGLLA